MGDPAQSHYLGNQFLIAMPQLAGSYFADTVTYLCKHDEQGALGIVINKPLGARVIDIFNELDISCDLRDSRFTTQRILSGGPVERDKGFIVHDATAHWDSSISVTPKFQSAHPEKSSRILLAVGGLKIILLRWAVRVGNPVSLKGKSAKMPGYSTGAT